MITEQELASAIVSVEQSIRDTEEARTKQKHDSAGLTELSLRLLIDKTKLQVLHYAQGVTGLISHEHLREATAAVEKYIGQLQAPLETDLFSPSENGKELERQKLIARTKLLALQFVAGEEKKIL